MSIFDDDLSINRFRSAVPALTVAGWALSKGYSKRTRRGESCALVGPQAISKAITTTAKHLNRSMIDALSAPTRIWVLLSHTAAAYLSKACATTPEVLHVRILGYNSSGF